MNWDNFVFNHKYYGEIELPEFYPSTIIVPYRFGRFPENLQEYILDNYECYTVDIEKESYIDKIKNHLISHPDIPMIRGGIFEQPFMLAYDSINRGVNGADLEALGPFGTELGSLNGQIVATKLNNGTVSELYNQIAIKVGATTAGNIRLGCYDDSSTLPNNLYSETASIASPSATTYTFQSVTEFALSTVLNWVAVQTDNSSFITERGALAGAARLKAQTYGSFQNPLTGSSNNDFTYKMKIGHS